MPVIINEFEVVAEPAPAQPIPPAPQPAAPEPTPHDIEQALRYQLVRAARVWAS